MIFLTKVSVLGAGSWGTALACLLNNNGNDVTLWSWQESEAKRLREDHENKEYLAGVLLDEKINITSDIGEAVKNKDVIVFAVPSKTVRQNANMIQPFVHEGQIIVNVSKGLEEETLLTLSEVLEEELPQCSISVLSGPSHAEEVGKNIPTTCVVSSKSKEVAETIQSLFMNEVFRVYTNPDIVGIELGAALKNVIALAAGISDGMGFGDNTKAALMTRGIVEISRLGVAMGANVRTFNGLAGVGDLIVTCTSMHSRNRRAGILLGQGKSLKEVLEEVHMVVEGVNTAKAAYNLSLKYNISMPLTKEIYKVLFENKNPRDAVSHLMTRNKTSEHEAEDINIDGTYNVKW